MKKSRLNWQAVQGLSEEEGRYKRFSEQYVELLKRFNLPHYQRYIFQPVDPN
jgi:hypothetical protein